MVFFMTDARKDQQNDGCAQDFDHLWRMCAKILWQMDARKGGRITRMHATYMTDACNPLNLHWRAYDLARVVVECLPFSSHLQASINRYSLSNESNSNSKMNQSESMCKSFSRSLPVDVSTEAPQQCPGNLNATAKREYLLNTLCNLSEVLMHDALVTPNETV